MWFDAQAALATAQQSGTTEAEPGLTATIATSATNEPQTKPRVAEVAIVATPLPKNQKIQQLPAKAVSDDMPHGFAFDWPKTWSGKIVNPADWQRLSEWERHGPAGRVWVGTTRQWEASK